MTTPLSPALERSAPRTSHLANDCSTHTDTPRDVGALTHRAHALGAPELRARSLEVQRGLREHLPALHRHATRRVRSREEALDLVQETALRALTFAWTFERGTNLRAWLHQVQDSVFLSRCRKRTRERRAFDAFYLDPCAWPKHGTEPAMQRMTQSVTRALDGLPSTFRDVVRLVDIEELSYRDAADALHVPLGTIMSRLHRGRRMLATALADSHSSRRPQPQSSPATRVRRAAPLAHSHSHSQQSASEPRSQTAAAHSQQSASEPRSQTAAALPKQAPSTAPANQRARAVRAARDEAKRAA